MDTFFSNKRMLHTNLCKSHSLVVMASYVSSATTYRSSMLNQSLMSFLDSLVFLVSICKTFVFDHFTKSTKKTWILPTFVNSTCKIPYGHLPIGSGSPSLSAGRLLGSLCETSLTPISSKSSTNAPLFKMCISSFQAFSLAIKAATLAQLIFSPFSYAM